MSISNTEPVPQAIIGKVIQSVASGVDDSGYGFVEFHFTDGTMFNVHEEGQIGEIRWNVPTIPTWPRDDEGFVTAKPNKTPKG